MDRDQYGREKVTLEELNRIIKEGGYIDYERNCIYDAKGKVLYHDVHMKKTLKN